MSQPLISRSPDLTRLVDEGFSVAVRSGHLVIDRVPYLNGRGELCFGMLVSDLTLAGEVTAKPENHVALFAGEHPCGGDGQPLRKISHQSDTKDLGGGLVVHHSFASKPAQGYADYYHKMTTYYGLVSAPAISKHPGIYLNEPAVLDQADDHEIFQYLDTASSRAGIGRITNKLRLDSVAIVGLGGTGAYVLDLVAKTPVRQIHLYDGDSFLQHNAFRSPGAASLEQLRARATKVEYFSATYSAMHKGIVPHNVYVTEENVSELRQMNFVFICLDNSVARKLIASALIEHKIPFVDVGMGIHAEGDSLLGIVRQTACTPHMNAHAASRIPMSSTDDHGPYDTNIQIADLNALNAALAVIKWKKLCGFYLDLDQEHHSTYTLDGNAMDNEERHVTTPTSDDAQVRRVRPR